MSAEIKKWLTDIQKSIGAIEEYHRDVPDLPILKQEVETILNTKQK